MAVLLVIVVGCHHRPEGFPLGIRDLGRRRVEHRVGPLDAHNGGRRLKYSTNHGREGDRGDEDDEDSPAVRWPEAVRNASYDSLWSLLLLLLLLSSLCSEAAWGDGVDVDADEVDAVDAVDDDAHIRGDCCSCSFTGRVKADVRVLRVWIADMVWFGLDWI